MRQKAELHRQNLLLQLDCRQADGEAECIKDGQTDEQKGHKGLKGNTSRQVGMEIDL